MSDARYLAWLRNQRCAVQPCILRAHSHHSTNAPAEQHEKSVGGKRGKSQKADDAHAFSLCPKHHGEFHNGWGFCEGWTKAERAKWQDEQVALYRGRYEEELEAGTVPTARATPATPLPTLKQVAEQFCSERDLGPQIAFDLTRLLEGLERERPF